MVIVSYTLQSVPGELNLDVLSKPNLLKLNQRIEKWALPPVNWNKIQWGDKYINTNSQITFKIIYFSSYVVQVHTDTYT